MQKTELKNANNITFSKEFTHKFKNALKEHFGYEEFMDFLVVPSITGKKTLSYLPIINYTDRKSDDIEDLKELSKENRFQIRALNFEYRDFKDNDTVTMRLDIGGFSSDELFMKTVKKKCRTKVRKSMKNGFEFAYGNGTKELDDFYTIFSDTMYMHGTPAFSKEFFISLSKEYKDSILFFNSYDNKKVISSYCVLLDKKIAWAGWGGVDMEYRGKLAGYFTQWNTIRSITDLYDKIEIFDFGRSPFNGGTYGYKAQFGATPVKIDIITSQTKDIYSKYSLASNIWKKLPKSMVDLIGPKLCKYLVDL